MSDILVSLHGRDVGLDKDRYLTSRVGIKIPSLFVGASGSELDVNAVTAASTASNLTASGITTLACTAVLTYTMDEPVTGLSKRLTATGASTSVRKVTLAAGTFGTTAGSTGNTLSFSQTGQAVSLQALSTALFQVFGNVGGVTCT